MSSSLQQIWSVLGTIWTTFFTGWHIPLLNFSPAVLLFGILSFTVAVRLIFGILNVTSQNVSASERTRHNEK